MQNKFRTAFLISVMVILLTACNFPGFQPVSTPDVVASQVSQLVTENPSQPTPTGLTFLPQTETPTPQAINTNTVEPSSTPTITSTPEGLPSGDPSWIENFNNGKSFGLDGNTYTDERTTIKVENGNLVLSSAIPDGWLGWRLTSQKPVNYYLEANFITQNCSGSDMYGLIIQSPDYTSGNGLHLRFTCDGQFSIQKWEDTAQTSILDWTKESAIHAGALQENRLGILKNGSNFGVYINGKQVSEFQDQTWQNPGVFGPFIAAQTTANFTYFVDNIAYWNLP